MAITDSEGHRLRVLTPPQSRFFETFGFLVVPGLFDDDIAEIDAAFEEVFADCGFGDTTTNNLGVPGEELPFWEVESRPGDMVVYDFMTQHASYGSIAPRRVFNLNGCVPV